MDQVLELFKAASSLEPLAVMAMMAAAIILLAKGRKEVNHKMDTLADNHLHELPLLVDNSRRTVDALTRIEIRLGELVSAIKER